jgi:high-affinity nickel-transport protein
MNSVNSDIVGINILLLATVFLYGFRHGFDWDHIAAITSLAEGGKDRKNSFLQSLVYILGHATVVILIGALVILLGVQLPEWLDPIMESIVGATLILLGVWLGLQILIKREFHFHSRWTLLAHLINRLLRKEHTHIHSKTPRISSRFSAFIIGCIHGIGAETPTQVLLFITVSGIGGRIIGFSLLFVFVLGLIIANITISLLPVFGLAKLQKNKRVYLFIGSVVALMSILVGAIFLFGKSPFLPHLL